MAIWIPGQSCQCKGNHGPPLLGGDDYSPTPGHTSCLYSRPRPLTCKMTFLKILQLIWVFLWQQAVTSLLHTALRMYPLSTPSLNPLAAMCSASSCQVELSQLGEVYFLHPVSFDHKQEAGNKHASQISHRL